MSADRPIVWIVDDDASIRRVLSHAVAAEERTCRTFESAEAALEALDEQAPDAVLTDLRMPGASGDVLIERIDAPVIVMSAYADLDSTVDALKRGAFDFLPKPFDLDEVVDRIDRALATRRGEPVSAPAETPADLVGESPIMRALFRAIGRLAGSSLSVLLRGESGSGKERIARALHASSPRADEAFVALNVAALPADLLESELFGHEKGAFSGADAARAGYFEQADGGTLFLDEIGEMPTALQSRLLRVLDDGAFYRLGGRAPVRVDVRIVAATHRDLEQAVASGEFREDLYHRLNVVPLTVPPLRERPEDIGPLLDHFLAHAAAEVGDLPRQLTDAARRRLLAHPWPGNVRELVNRCRRWTALVPGPRLDVADLDLDRPAEDVDWTRALRAWARVRLAAGDRDLMRDAVERAEQVLIDEALKATGGRRAEAAERLGIGRNTLTRKLDDA